MRQDKQCSFRRAPGFAAPTLARARDPDLQRKTEATAHTRLTPGQGRSMASKATPIILLSWTVRRSHMGLMHPASLRETNARCSWPNAHARLTDGGAETDCQLGRTRQMQSRPPAERRDARCSSCAASLSSCCNGASIPIRLTPRTLRATAQWFLAPVAPSSDTLTQSQAAARRERARANCCASRRREAARRVPLRPPRHNARRQQFSRHFGRQRDER